MDEDKIAINISKSVYDEIKNRIMKRGREFNSVESYVEFVLREFFKEQDKEETYTKEEEELIKKRLRRLGYL